MSIERQQRIEQVFHLASELPQIEQYEFVNLQLQDDPQAIQEVLELLAIDAQDSVVLDRILNSPQQVSKAVVHDHQLNRVGAYLIEKEISHGGMGRVFLGRRDDEAYESLVAIKLVRVEKNSEWAEKRFLEERQILARLNHPNIATLLDGGTTEQGQPYVVMQYIDGQAVNSYCQNTDLSLKQKLSLFVKICQAISYAHKNLVIHRDIKPANILVDQQGEPKLLDFGIAKIISDELNTGDVTQMGIMTPSYASPEQVRGEVISTASDIYSLGVLLYELLAQQPPFDVGSGSPAEIVKAVCNTEPTRPSAQVSEPHLAKSLQGDLDNIILKAMQKDPAQRYGSADEFIADIQRYLSGHAVIAAGNSSWYKTGKFIRRHWLGISAVSVFLLTLASLTTFYTLKLATERDRAIQAEAAATAAQLEAERESKTANRVSEFLTDMFAANDPSAGIGGKDMSARELLDIGSKTINDSLDEEPQTKAHLLRTIGLAYFNLGEQEPGIIHLRESLALHRIHSEPPVQAEAINRLANILRQADEYDEAVSLYREALALHESYSDEPTWELADAYNNFGLLIYYLAQYGEAEMYLKKAIKTHRAAAEVRDDSVDRDQYVTSVGISMHNLSLIQRVMGKYQEAEAIVKESLDIRAAELGGEDSNSWAISLQQLGRIQNDLGRFQEALTVLDKAIDKHRVHYEEDNSRMGTLWSRIANSHHALGNYDLAEKFYLKAIKIFSDIRGMDSSLVVYTETQYGSLLRQNGQLLQAEKALRHSLKVNQEMYIASHPNTALTATELAAVLAESGQLSEASKLIESAIMGYEKHFDETHPELAWARLIKSKILRHSNQLKAANHLFDQVFVIINKNQSQNPIHFAQAKYEQSLLAASEQQCDQYHQYFVQAQSTLKSLNSSHDLLANMAPSLLCE